MPSYAAGMARKQMSATIEVIASVQTPIFNPRPDGYGSRFVCLSNALQRAALTSSHQLRYEQAKHVDGLQSDSWILLKCFRSRVMAGESP